MRVKVLPKATGNPGVTLFLSLLHAERVSNGGLLSLQLHDEQTFSPKGMAVGDSIVLADTLVI